MVQLANTVWRDFVTDGVPASGSWKPQKKDARQWGTWLEGIVTAFTSNGGLIYISLAAMNADLAHGANSSAWVVGDATVANNGIYQKLGASGAGSWSRVADLPYSFIKATDAGAGTANAIIATTAIPLPANDAATLIALNITTNNTSAATVAFNGGSPLTIKTNNGNDVAADYLVAGAIVAGYVSGSTFRLISDVASAADRAAAEAAAAAAAASASSINLPSPVALTFLQRNSGNTAYDAKTAAQVSSVLFMVANAKLSGCVGDNVADDTAAIQALINTGVKRIRFPAGTYKISDDITITAPVILEGDGAKNTVIRQTGAAKNGILFDFPTLVQGGGISGITIEAGAGFLTSGFTGSGSTGVGLRVQKSNGRFYARDFGVNNFDTGLSVLGCWYPQFKSFDILGCTTVGLLVAASGATIGGGWLFSDGKISNFGFTGTNTASYGIQVTASGGGWFKAIDVTSFNKNISLKPTATEAVLYVFFSDVLGDTAVTNNWEFDGTSNILSSITMSNCWGAYSTSGSGVVFKGANLNSIKWVGGSIRENGTHGAHLQGGVNVQLMGVEIASNSKATANTSVGVMVDAGVSEWSVIGCRIGNFASIFTGHAENIMIAAGASQNFRIIANDLRLSGSGKVQLANGSSTLNFIIKDNLPLQSTGVNASSRTGLSAGSGGTGVAAGSTGYLGPSGYMANVNDSPFVAAKIGVVTGFFAASVAAPGAAQTFTYTVYKNGVATSMTGQISGDAAFSVGSTANGFNVAPTDTITMQLVTSAGATATKHRFVIYLED